MPESGTVSRGSSKAAGKGRLPQLARVAGIGLAVLVVLYFVLTSGVFIKSVVLPKVSAAINAKLTAQDVSLSPFSGVAIKGIKLETFGPEPLFQADEISVSYDLLAMLRKNIVISEVKVVGPKVGVIVQADGKSNLEPLLAGAPPKKEGKTEQGEPPRIDLRRISVTKAAASFTKHGAAGARQVSRIADLNIAVDQVKKGQMGKMTIGADVWQENTAPTNAPAQGDQIHAALNGGFDFMLDAKLLPSLLKGEVKLAVAEGRGAFKDLTGQAAIFRCDVTGTELKDLTLLFEKGGQRQGQVQASGPFEMAKSEARLRFEVSSVDRNVLNLAGAPLGMDFGRTAINASGLVDVSRRGEVVGARGKVTVREFSVAKQGARTPRLDVDLDYQFVANVAEKTAVLHKLSLAGRDQKHELLNASLDKPMNLSWGATVYGMTEANLSFALNQFDLAEWVPFFTTNTMAGVLSAKATLNSQRDGRRTNLEASATLEGLAAQAGDTGIRQADLNLWLQGQFNDFKSLLVDRFTFKFAHEGRPVVSASGSASYNLETKDSNVQLVSESDFVNAMRLAPKTPLEVASGKVKLDGFLAREKGIQTVRAKVALDSFAGRINLTNLVAECRFENYHASVEGDIELKESQLNIRRASLALRQGVDSGGTFDLGGKVDLEKKVGDFSFSLVNLNQRALEPFVKPFLAPRSLASGAVNAKGSAHFDMAGESTLQLQTDLSDLKVTEPSKKLAGTPIEMQFVVDASYRSNEVELRKFIMALAPGAPGANEVQVQGKINLSNKVSALSMKIADLNEQGLGPLFAPFLAPNKLTSISIKGKGDVLYNPAGTGRVEMAADLSRLVIRDPENTLPSEPLAMQFALDIGQQKMAFDIKKLRLALPPTSRAKNEITAQGKLDLNTNNPAPSRLALASDAVDLTPLYDLFMTNRPPAAKKPDTAKAEAKGPANTNAPVEPPPVQLPVQDLEASLKIDRFYLRETTISDWLATLKIDRGQLQIKPCRLNLNGTPVSAEVSVNLNKPGYAYSLDLQANGIALEPLVNTFTPEKRGQVKGELFATARINGAGTTGASLRKSLVGTAHFSLTNMNLQAVGPKTKRLLTPIALVLRVPEIEDSPLDFITADSKMGSGRIDLENTLLKSPAFVGTANGNIQVAEVLTNSPLDIPVGLALRRSLAEKAKVMPANAPPDADYVALPQFAKVIGTVGDPKTDVDKTKIAGLLAGSIGGAVGGKAGDILQGAGGLLKGEKPALGGVLTNLLQKPKSDGKTNTPPKASPLDILRGLAPKQ